MRRSGHIRERTPGSFELRYSLGTDPATGKGGSRPKPAVAPARRPSGSYAGCPTRSTLASMLTRTGSP